MKPIKIKYNIEDDILYIYFSENEPCWSAELGNDIILRASIKTNKAVSLEVLSFSKTKFKFEMEGK